MIRKRFFKIKYLLVVLVLIGIGFYIKGKNAPIEVIVVEPSMQKVSQTVSASGVLKAQNEATLSFVSTGRMSFIPVEKGQVVKSGTFLGQLNAVTNNLVLQTVRDSRDIALREKELFIEQYQYDKDLLGGNDEYEIQMRIYNERISQAEASLRAEQSTLTNLYIYAPFEGTILDTYYKVGETVAAGVPVIKIADLTKLVFEIQVDQEDYGMLKIGQRVEVTFDSYSDQTFEGTISDLPYFADETSSEFIVDIAINPSNNVDQPLLLGMKGDAKIIVSQVENEVNSLTFDSLFEDEKGYFVWQEKEGRAQKLYLEIGLEGDLFTEIKTNLTSYKIITPADSKNTFEEGKKVVFAK